MLERDDHSIIGLEIKASKSVGPNDFKGLKKLAEFNPEKFDYGAVFYNGD